MAALHKNKKVLPMSISNMMTPKDHQSQLLSYPAPITAIKKLKNKSRRKPSKWST
jgi:hypothetical protein